MSLFPRGDGRCWKGLAPAGTTEVVLERVSPGPRTVVARVAPADDGVFSFAVRVPEPRRYRVRAGSASSPVVRVRVTPHVTIARRGSAIAVSTRPSRAGSRVAVQVYDREKFDFVTVARGRLGAVVSGEDSLRLRGQSTRSCGGSRQQGLERRLQPAASHPAALI